jgi:hypothetical protein
MNKAIVLLVLVVTAACGAYRFPGSDGGSGTVSGQVIANQCGGPVQPASPICVPAPNPESGCAATSDGEACGSFPIPGLELDFTSGGTSLATKTGSGGDYSIELPAGTWTVTTRSIMRIISGPQTLVVTAGARIVANYVVDTGIRAATQSG